MEIEAVAAETTATEAAAANVGTIALGSSVVMAPVSAAGSENSTSVENSVELTAAEQAVHDELEVLRKRYQGDQKSNRDENKALEQTQQQRLHEFLKVGYYQARELMRDENRALLNSVLLAHKITPGSSTTKLMQQIAALQLASPGSKKVIPGRRNERIGVLYRIFFDKGWTAENLLANIEKGKGTTKIIDQDIRDRRDPEENQKLVRRASTVHDDEYGTLFIPMQDVTVKNSGDWRLALVSVHDGGVRLRQLVGASEDSATTKARDAYCTDAYVDLRARVLDGTTPEA